MSDFQLFQGAYFIRCVGEGARNGLNDVLVGQGHTTNKDQRDGIIVWPAATANANFGAAMLGITDVVFVEPASESVEDNQRFWFIWTGEVVVRANFTPGGRMKKVGWFWEWLGFKSAVVEDGVPELNREEKALWKEW